MSARERPRRSNACAATEQRLRAIEAARNPDHQPLDPRGLEPLHQAGHLNIVSFVTILCEPRGIGGDEREPRHGTFQAPVGIGGIEPERDRAERRNGRVTTVVIERALARALLPQHIQIDVGDRVLRAVRETLGFRESDAVLKDRGLTVPGKVGRALARARRGIKVRREAARRLRLAEQPAGLRLADRDVARG